MRLRRRQRVEVGAAAIPRDCTDWASLISLAAAACRPVSGWSTRDDRRRYSSIGSSRLDRRARVRTGGGRACAARLARRCRRNGTPNMQCKAERACRGARKARVRRLRSNELSRQPGARVARDPASHRYRHDASHEAGETIGRPEAAAAPPEPAMHRARGDHWVQVPPAKRWRTVAQAAGPGGASGGSNSSFATSRTTCRAALNARGAELPAAFGSAAAPRRELGWRRRVTRFDIVLGLQNKAVETPGIGKPGWCSGCRGAAGPLVGELVVRRRQSLPPSTQSAHILFLSSHMATPDNHFIYPDVRIHNGEATP